MSLLSRLFDITRRDLKRMWPMVRRINALEPQMQALTDVQLRAKTDEFRQRLANDEKLDDLLIEAFAVNREAARRTIGMRHFDVQLIGGIVLHEGKIAEMKTGEGKTLVATLPLYLNALTGRGCHLVTHNDYLAKRDREWMGPVYEFLGLTVGLLQHEIEDIEERRRAYQCDIIYGTNTEFGFDYLRDNGRLSLEHVVQRELNYAIVDEVDSLLIDEARTPLIIAAPVATPTSLYEKVSRAVGQLEREVDYIVDEKVKSAALTDQGQTKAERLLAVRNLTDLENAEVYQHVVAALRAHACYKSDVDYVVKDGEVIIVDEFTGRLMFGRRYAEGLHQAIEAKEGVKIERESQTVATISIQNYFRLYEKLAGMTGTAKTEEQEFIKIYGMPVVVIPTHKPMIRADHADVVYKTQEAKFRGIVSEILQLESLGRPVLVGSRSIEVSESLSERLKPEWLRRFAQAAILHNELQGADQLNDVQRRELDLACRERLRDLRVEREHLEKAIDLFDLHPSRMTEPEELQQLQRRLRKVSAVESDMESYSEKLRSGEKLSRGELHRLADLITYVPLDQLNPGRLSALLKSMGVDPNLRSSKALEILSEIIGLNGAAQAGSPQGSERLAELLRTGIPHQVLNAKYHEQEARIIANAGRSKTMTIATNMAGRGVDILLGGNHQRVAEEVFQERGIDAEEADENRRAAALEEAKRRCEEDRKRVIELSGLHILGTERHESRRIDNQLRGRSGRQGDPGTSRFYVSLEDELWRLYGVERFDFLLSKWNECEPVESRIVSKQIEGAQGKVEAHHFYMRQQLLRYDDVKNLQREVIYKQRRRVMEGADLKESILESMRKWAADRVSQYASPEVHPDEWDFTGLLQAMRDMFPLDLFVSESQVKETRDFNSLAQLLQEAIAAAYEDKEQQVGPEQMRELERHITLWVIDQKWVDHLDALDFLEEGISYRSYAGVDPLVAFQKEGFALWQSLQVSVQEDIMRFLFRAQVAHAPRHTSRVAAGRTVGPGAVAEDDEEEVRPAPVRLKAKVGRNDPCPCGSGKKYKKCCLNKVM